MLLGGPSTEIGCSKLPEVTKARCGSGTTGPEIGAGAGTLGGAGAVLTAGAGAVAGASAGACHCAWVVDDKDGQRSASQPGWPPM